jgi:hypothetical protein
VSTSSSWGRVRVSTEQNGVGTIYQDDDCRGFFVSTAAPERRDTSAALARGGNKESI